MNKPTLLNDDSLKMPAAVRAASARSDQLHRQIHGPQDPAPQDPNPGVTSEGNPTPSETRSSQDPAPQDPVPQDPAPQDPAPKDLNPGVTSEGNSDDTSWEHKYRSAHGRLLTAQRQIQTLNGEIQSRDDRIRNLQATIATMEMSPKSPSTAPLAEANPAELLTPQEIADYGEDFLRIVEKQARLSVAPVIQRYEGEIENLKARVQGVASVVKQDTQQQMISSLDKELPKWREVNYDENFLNWLRLPDPYSGAIRHDILKSAYAQGDSHRVLAFFKGFLAEEAVVAPVETGPDSRGQVVPKVPLANLAAPGKAKAAAQVVTPAEKPTITRAQVSAFYADVAAGKYRGREAEKDQHEARIFEAQRDGRII